MIQLTATGRDARATPSEPITAGSVGLPVVLDLSSDFDGLAVTVCFEAGEAKADVAYLGDPVTVPAQCLTVVGVVLRIGVYGALPNGTIVIPTVWAIVGLVRKGAMPSGVDPAQPEPDWTAQVLAAARDARATVERIAGEVDDWAEAEQARATAEQGRADAEALRRSAEQARADAETGRALAETQRAAAEGIRVSNETTRTSNELARATAEQGRATAETGRALAETARTEAEQVRATAETARNGAEAARAQAEQQRADAERQRAEAETARATAEQARATAEQGRATAETARAEAETLRATAEQGRADAETERSQAWAELEADVTAATDAATEAAAALRPEVTWLRGNQLTKELSGELMQASDAYGAPMLSMGVDGKSTQVTTTGRNMVNPSTLSNGYIRNDGTVYGSASTYKHTDYLPATAGTTYRVSQNGIAFNAIYTAFYDSDKAFIEAKSQNSMVAPTFTAPAGTAYLRASFNGAQASRAQVEIDSGSWTGYEPYTGGLPSPSPAYPQEVVSADSIELEFANKNLFKVKDGHLSGVTEYTLDYASGVLVFSGTTSWAAGSKAFVISENNSVNSSNNYLGQPVLRNYQSYARPIKRGTYTFSATQTGQMVACLRVGHLYADGTKIDNGTTFEVTDDDWYYIFVVQVSNRSTDATTYLYPMLEVGSTATEFEPHSETLATIDLTEHPLRSLPDGTKDTLALTYLRPSTREGWAWYQATLTALVGVTTTAATDGVTGTVGVDAMSTTGEIADGPTVLYKLATHITTQLDPTELPILPAPTCTVWADPTTGLQMEYVRDTSIVIASLEAAYADLATS